MNVSELARTLRVNPNELRNTLPKLGFDIGQKAIKVDNKIAQRIIANWHFLVRNLKDQEEKEKQELEKENLRRQVAKIVKIPHLITVKDFSLALNLPVNKILPELMRNGIFVSINEKIDFETALIIGADLGVEVILDENQETDKESTQGLEKLKKALEEGANENRLTSRPPVIVVMGHVDHGKTSLLDVIRKTNVIEGEAGGITQHIGAYQVKRNDQIITFIDTPGHEAFTAMRSRGARVADIAILVVAADDGVKPQTKESYNIIKAAGLPFIVAINKIDKEGSDVAKVKQELANQLNILSEDWGGKIICAPISAKTGQGIGELLDLVLLTAEVEGENMKADQRAKAIGTVIESKISKGEGPVATILIQNGTLKLNDEIAINGQHYGKVKALKNYKAEIVQKAGPAFPVRMIGLKKMPKVGDIACVEKGIKTKFKKERSNFLNSKISLNQENQENDTSKKLNIILKADFLGSIEAIVESLEKINTAKVKIKILAQGLGNITEGDIVKAENSGATLYGFNVKMPANVESLARNKKIKVEIYNIIYDLLNSAKEKAIDLIEAEYERVELGRVKVLAIFRTEANVQIVGGKVLEGQAEKDSQIEVWRDKELITKGKISNLQTGKQDIKAVEIDNECGISYEGKPLIQTGDILNFYRIQETLHASQSL